MASVTERFLTTGDGLLSTTDLSQQATTCSVLCLSFVDYDTRAVTDQLTLKERLHAQLTLALRHVGAQDRIVLDTHDGIAINFLGRPEDAFLTAVLLRDAFALHPSETGNAQVRMGLNAGPVRLVSDPKGRAVIVGDGINVARRVMMFAPSGSVLLSRSFFESVAHVAEAHHDVFTYFGARTDNHVRTHELYEITLQGDTSEKLEQITGRSLGTDDDAALSSNDERFDANATSAAKRWLHDIRAASLALAIAAACLVVAVLLASTRSASGDRAPTHTQAQQAARPAAARTEKIMARDVKVTTDAIAPPPIAADHKSLAELPRAKMPTAITADRSGHPDNSRAARGNNRTSGTAQTFAVQSAPSEITPPRAVEAAVVSLAVAPWGEVFVNGQRAGVSPPLDHVEVEPGMVHIEIRNSGAQSYSEVVTLAAGEQTRVKYKFPNP